MEEGIKFALGCGKRDGNYFIRIHCNYPFIGIDKMGFTLYCSNTNSELVIAYLKQNMNTLKDDNNKYLDIFFIADYAKFDGKVPEKETVDKIYEEVKETLYKVISQNLYEKKYKDEFNLNQDDENFIWNN